MASVHGARDGEAPRFGPRLWRGALVGLVAAVLAVVVQLTVRLATGTTSLGELAAEWLTTWLPIGFVGWALRSFEGMAKPLLFAGAFVSQLVLGAALGSLFELARARWQGARLWLAGGALGLALWLVAIMLLQPAESAGREALSLLLTTLTYGLALAAVGRLEGWQVERLGASDVGTLQPSNLPTLKPANPAARRAALARLGWGAALIAASAGMCRLWSRPINSDMAAGAVPGGRSRGQLPPEITPNDEFYVVSKNFRDPVVEARGWQLQIAGLIDQRLSFDYDELARLATVEQAVTLECISNEVGGDLISSTRWRGVRLRDLLERAGVRQGARKVVFHAADGYSDSFPIEKALHPDTLLALFMNGEPLPGNHGFPARLLVPGIYGMKNVKWVTRVEVVDYDYRGYWQQRGWSDTAVVKTMSRVDAPRASVLTREQARLIGGVAYAGDRGLSKVEVSTDGQRTWQEARLRPALGKATWVLWEFPWDPAPGTYQLTVRAWDGEGQLQTEKPAPPLPDGADGYHSITVRVQAA